jgi:hypothetical protein
MADMTPQELRAVEMAMSALRRAFPWRNTIWSERRRCIDVDISLGKPPGQGKMAPK